MTSSASRDIRSGNEESAFRVVQDGSLRTAKQFDHNIKDKYVLKIRVFAFVRSCAGGGMRIPTF